MEHRVRFDNSRLQSSHATTKFNVCSSIAGGFLFCFFPLSTSVYGHRVIKRHSTAVLKEFETSEKINVKGICVL